MIHRTTGGVKPPTLSFAVPQKEIAAQQKRSTAMSLDSDIKLTPSRTRDYLACPLKFGRLYGPAEEYQSIYPKAPSSEQMDNVNKSRAAAMALGNCLHAALDSLHRPSSTESLGLNAPHPTQAGANCSKIPSDEELSQMISRHWRSDGYEDSQSEEAAYLQACDILKYYARSDHMPKGQVLATEAYLTAVTTLRGYRVEISCRADRLELHDDGTLEVLDYKLTRNGELPSAHTLSEDLSSYLYWLLTWHHYRRDPRVRNIRISQLSLLKLSKVQVEYDQHQVIKHREALIELVTSVMERSLEPRVNAGCAWCPVQQTCPAWSELDLANLDSYADWSLRG